jgi:hypothetical protein
MKSIKGKIREARLGFIRYTPDWIPPETCFNLYCNIPSLIAIQDPLTERIENYETSKRTR